MGLLDRLRAKRAFGRVSEKADTGVDIARKPGVTYKTTYGEDGKVKSVVPLNDKPRKKEGKDTELFESKEEKQARREEARKNNPMRKAVKSFAQGKQKVGKTMSGFDFGNMSNDMLGLNEKPRKGKQRDFTSELLGDVGGSGSFDVGDMLGMKGSKRRKRNDDPFGLFS